MFRSDEIVVHGFCFVRGHQQNLLQDRCERRRSVLFRASCGSRIFLDFKAQALKIDSDRFQRGDCNPFSKRDDSEQQMFCADIIMIEVLRLFLRKDQDMFCARSKIFDQLFKSSGSGMG